MLEDAGFTVRIDGDLDGAMTRLDGVDLLVVNAGDPWRGDGRSAGSRVGCRIRCGSRSRLGILGMHAAAATMRDYPEWPEAFGAIWLPGLSWHPPLAWRGSHDVAAWCPPRGLRRLDERYSGLQRVGTSDIVATHEVDGVVHPTAWIRMVGRARVAADVLGHDERSYDSAGHRALLSNLARWTSGEISLD